MTSTVIVYYSKDNNTRTGAQILGGRLSAKVVELKEVKKGNFLQALTKKGSKLEGNPWDEIKNAEKLYLMSPIWASNGVPAMNAFLDKADLTNKEVVIITFQQFPDLRNSDQVHKYLTNKVQNKKGNVLECHAFLGGKMGHCAEESAIRAQIDSLF